MEPGKKDFVWKMSYLFIQSNDITYFIWSIIFSSYESFKRWPDCVNKDVVRIPSAVSLMSLLFWYQTATETFHLPFIFQASASHYYTYPYAYYLLIPTVEKISEW